MECEQRVEQGRAEIGKGALYWIFGDDVDLSNVTAEQLIALGELIEGIGLRIEIKDEALTVDGMIRRTE